jgi:hypothetical protein
MAETASPPEVRRARHPQVIPSFAAVKGVVAQTIARVAF